MKKLALLLLTLIMFFSCVPKDREKAERLIEDGVEVIINHLEPSKIKGEPTSFTLEEEFRIDTENEDLAELGIRGIDEMDVDREGSIYFSTGEKVLKFDNTGAFVQTVGRTGQGPGEYRMATSLRITDSGLMSFFDAENSKFLFFNPDGTLEKEIKKAARMFTFVGIYLDNGHFLLRERADEPEKGIRTFRFVLFDQNFEKIKDLLPSFWLEIPYFQTDKISLLGYSMSYALSNGKILISSNVTDNLEIEIYDFQGELIKKIRKKTEKIAVSKAYKERIIERWKKFPAWEELNYKEKHYFPEYFPPFKEFWVDEEERIFVETYKEGESPEEVLVQIFNPEGIFVGTKYLKEARSRKFKEDHLYCAYRKESGFEDLIAYKIIWQE
jgi:hypothetical protein